MLRTTTVDPWIWRKNEFHVFRPQLPFIHLSMPTGVVGRASSASSKEWEVTCLKTSIETSSEGAIAFPIRNSNLHGNIFGVWYDLPRIGVIPTDKTRKRDTSEWLWRGPRYSVDVCQTSKSESRSNSLVLCISWRTPANSRRGMPRCWKTNVRTRLSRRSAFHWPTYHTIISLSWTVRHFRPKTCPSRVKG